MAKHAKAQILDAAGIRRVLTRIAHEIVEHNQGTDDLVLIGVVKRGDVLAHRLAALLRDIEGKAPPVGALDITFYRDDVRSRALPTEAHPPSHLPFPLEGRRVILVDDVLFTGRSIRAAMMELIDYGRPRAVQLAVVIDRGHRELPIHADYVGKNVPTALREDVEVRLEEHDGEEGVFILEDAAAPGGGEG